MVSEKKTESSPLFLQKFLEFGQLQRQTTAVVTYR